MKKWSTSDKKEYIKQNVFMKPEVCERAINGYKEETLGPFNPTSDNNYLAEVLLRKLKQTMTFESEKKEEVSCLNGAINILRIFKDWVENNKGWDDIQSAPSTKREKVVQRLIHLAGKYYVQVNNLDFSFESDSGRGTVDLKLSRGNEKVLIEVKLSSNGQYLHGYEEQIQEYGKVEGTDNLIYVFVNLGNSGRRNAIIKKHKKNINVGIKYPMLFLIDAIKKNAASTYNVTSETLTCDLPELDLSINDISLPDFIDFEF